MRRGVSTIPAHLPFLDSLVAGLFTAYGRDPLPLADITILLPTRRACRALREAFLRASDGEPMLLPRMAALGDVDDDEIDLAAPAELAGTIDLPPAISLLKRQLLLAQLVIKWGKHTEGGDILPGQAIALADELGRLIDQAHTEGVDFANLDGLVPEELAAHWDVTLNFLSIVRESWPALLAAHGMIDPADRRNRLVAAQIALWIVKPPTAPVVAAGFSSAIPAVADLLAAVAKLPQGSVVLPGLDLDADETLWAAIGEDATHPQNGLAKLLEALGIARRDVTPLSGSADGVSAGGRAALAREIMRPASVTDQWRRLDGFSARVFDGLTRLDLATPHEEAGTIALLLRSQLEQRGSTAMLVTPDRGLARRVASELRRWDIDIDDSAGAPLNQTPPGVLLRLLNEAVAENLAPVPLLALLKHPMVGGGAGFRERVRSLERHCLRGPRPGAGLAGLHAVAAIDTECATLVSWLDEVLSDFITLADEPAIALHEIIAAHVRTAELLVADDRLWALEAGEAMAGFIAEFLDAAPSFGTIGDGDYTVMFEAALAGRVVRPIWGKHPRLQILGALEARLQSADLIVLAGLNEGIWPATPPHDPWMSRQMRQRFGLPPSEALIGVAAHDFVMSFNAPEIVLTRAARAEGAPTVPSRWLLRLDTVLKAVGLDRLPAGRHGFEVFPAYQAMLDHPEEIRSMAPPEPRPPVNFRPRKLSVTAIETWMRDPYAIYARHILKLTALAGLDEDPGAADRGNFIHAALDYFIRAYPGPLTDASFDQLEAAGRDAFGSALTRPGVWAFWWPRFLRIADWIINLERERRSTLAESYTEQRGEIVFDAPAGKFILTANADRIDRFKAGGLALIDYKTGAVPSHKEVRGGLSPQLPLEAAMAEIGGFKRVGPSPVLELGFWKLSGGDPAGDFALFDDAAELAAAARAGLSRLIALFDNPRTPYLARPKPDYAPRYSDYTHLARILEWGAEGAD